MESKFLTGRNIGKAALKAFMGLCLALGIFSGGGIFRQQFVLEARAAEELWVNGLGVTQSEDGVSAWCDFWGYQEPGYILELYLNRVEEDGTVTPVAGGILNPTQDGTGTGTTEGVKVTPGIYKATAVWQRKGGDFPVSFQDSPLYDVAKEGERYTVTLHHDTVPEAGPEESSQGQKGSSQPFESGEEEAGEPWQGCSHHIVYEIVQPADRERDALLAGQCSICGDVASYTDVPNSAYEAFLEETVDMVHRAGQGEVVIATSLWISFNREVLDAVMEHPGLSVKVFYRYEGVQYLVTIPAGADLGGLAGDDGFCGFRYLDLVFGGERLAEDNF